MHNGICKTTTKKKHCKSNTEALWLKTQHTALCQPESLPFDDEIAYKTKSYMIVELLGGCFYLLLLTTACSTCNIDKLFEEKIVFKPHNLQCYLW